MVKPQLSKLTTLLLSSSKICQKVRQNCQKVPQKCQARKRSKDRHRQHLAKSRKTPDQRWSRPKENSKLSLDKSKAHSRTSTPVSNPYLRDSVTPLAQSWIRSRENSEVPLTSSRQSLVMLRLMPKESWITSRTPKLEKSAKIFRPRWTKSPLRPVALSMSSTLRLPIWSTTPKHTVEN